MADRSAIEATIAAYFAAIRALDPEGIVATMTEDVISNDPADTPTLEGRAAVRGFFEGAAGAFARLDIHPRRVFVRGHEAAVYFTAEGDSHGGHPITFDGVDLLTFDDAGKIRALRAYWYPEEALSALQGQAD